MERMVAMDLIGRRRLMERMVATDCIEIQARFLWMNSLRGCAKSWAVGLSTKLLECTHGQWLYLNVIAHDNECGTSRSLRKEQILTEIEAQLVKDDPLLDEDQYLLEINIGDISNGTGEYQQEYWLLAMQAARRAKQARDHATEGIG